MYCVDFTGSHDAVPYDSETQYIHGECVAAFSGADSAYLIIDRTNVAGEKHLALQADCIEFSLALAGSAHVVVKTPDAEIKNLADQQWKSLVNHSLSYFVADCEALFNQTVERLKHKKSGDNVLIDLENVRLSITDYHRFLFQLHAAVESVPDDLGPLAERAMLAADILSNLQGGISVLHQGSVELHLQYALWLKQLETQRC